uniref:BOS complex subunit TMEM147 n=1 Tax=Steinernema glaseri TaxID=37863 RepID=A0A1I7Y2P0_9BILA
MTFFHFVNCVLLAYAPIVLTYKYSGLSEYSTVWKCLQAAMAYFVTQFSKMMVLATFFPTPENDEFDVFMELMKNSADIFDVIGMHLAMNHLLTGRGEMRFIAAGVGWAGAHSLANYFVTFVTGARATAFSWSYIQTAFLANNDLFFYVSMATLVWLFGRNDLTVASKRVVIGLLVFCVFHSTLYIGIRSWTLVLSKTLCTAALSLMTLISYSGLGSQKNHH